MSILYTSKQAGCRLQGCQGSRRPECWCWPQAGEIKRNPPAELLSSHSMLGAHTKRLFGRQAPLPLQRARTTNNHSTSIKIFQHCISSDWAFQLRQPETHLASSGMRSSAVEVLTPNKRTHPTTTMGWTTPGTKAIHCGDVWGYAQPAGNH